MTEVVTFKWENGAKVSLRANGGGAEDLAQLCAQFGPPAAADWNPLASFKGEVFRRKWTGGGDDDNEWCYLPPVATRIS